MNRKRKPKQRTRANRKIQRKRRGDRLDKHQLDVRVKRREGEGIRRHFRFPLIAKVATIAIAVVLLAFIAHNIVGRFLWNNPAYTLEKIEYGTDGWMTRSQALEIAGVEPGTNVLRLNLEEIRNRLIALPQVKDAGVIRTLPDKLELSVIERHPIAWLDCPEQEIYPRVRTNGVLLDEDGVAMPCDQMRADYVGFPTVRFGGLEAVKLGQQVRPIWPKIDGVPAEESHGESYQLACALELVTASREILYDHAMEIVEIEALTHYSLLARFNNQSEVTFKPSDIMRRKDMPQPRDDEELILNKIEQQVSVLKGIHETYARQNKRLATVNLLPDRNIPVTFAEQSVSASIPRGHQGSGSIHGPANPSTAPRSARPANDPKPFFNARPRV